MDLPYEELCGRLGVTPKGDSMMARCPAHDDKNPSLSLTRSEDGTAIVHCFAGCDWREVSEALGVSRRGVSTPTRNAATLQRLPKTPGKQASQSVAPESKGCTLAQYAEAKKLPLEFLQSLSLQEVSNKGNPALRIPYLSPEGQTVAVRLRIALDAKDRFRWKSRDKPQLYGLWRLDTKAAVARLTSTQTCW